MWNERVQTGDPSPTPENARSVTGAINRLNCFLLTQLFVVSKCSCRDNCEAMSSTAPSRSVTLLGARAGI